MIISPFLSIFSKGIAINSLDELRLNGIEYKPKEILQNFFKNLIGNIEYVVTLIWREHRLDIKSALPELFTRILKKTKKTNLFA